MLAMYLLGHPDHYTDHEFIPFYWKTFVNEVRNFWLLPDEESEGNNKVIIVRQKGNLRGYSPVMDCIYQGEQLENMNLYQWIRQCKCLPMPKSRKNKKKQCSESEEESDNNDSDNDSIIDEKKPV